MSYDNKKIAAAIEVYTYAKSSDNPYVDRETARDLLRDVIYNYDDYDIDKDTMQMLVHALLDCEPVPISKNRSLKINDQNRRINELVKKNKLLVEENRVLKQQNGDLKNVLKEYYNESTI